MTTLSPLQQAHVKDTPARSSVASSSVVESTEGYDDIFDRLDTDLGVLLLSTTTDDHADQEDGISVATELETHSTQGKLDKPHLSQNQQSQQSQQHVTDKSSQPTMTEEDVIEKCTIKTEVDFYSLVANDSSGAPFDFEQLRGKYVLICNVASMCGFSFQLRFLNDLYEKYKDDVVVLGFPSNNFAQEWFNAEDASTCYKLIWNCNFKIMEKIRVNGKKQHQVFRYLKDHKKGFMGTKRVKWNFEKFLVDRNGTIIRRYSTLQFPYVIKNDLDAILAKDLSERQSMSNISTPIQKTDAVQSNISITKIHRRASTLT